MYYMTEMENYSPYVLMSNVTLQTHYHCILPGPFIIILPSKLQKAINFNDTFHYCVNANRLSVKTVAASNLLAVVAVSLIC